MFLDTRLGNFPRWWLAPPKDQLMRVPDEVVKSVVFVGTRTYHGGVERTTWRGTAFKVSVRSTKTHVFNYLVTAKHVADKLGNGKWVVRANTLNGSSVVFEANNSVCWFVGGIIQPIKSRSM